MTSRLVKDPAPESIGLGRWANLAALTKDDPDPLQVVARIETGPGITDATLAAIAAKVNSRGIPAHMGRPRAENTSWQFLPIAGHWIGALVKPEAGKSVLYVRGLVDKSAEALKRYITGNVVDQVEVALAKGATGPIAMSLNYLAPGTGDRADNDPPPPPGKTEAKSLLTRHTHRSGDPTGVAPADVRQPVVAITKAVPAAKQASRPGGIDPAGTSPLLVRRGRR